MAQQYTQEQLAALLLAQQRAAQPQYQYGYQAPQQQQYYYQAAPQYAAMQRPVQQPLTVTLTLPADAVPGMSYEFQAPDGRMLSFQVPAGYGPGMPISVSC